MTCDKKDKQKFLNCLKSQVPLGSNFSYLKTFLIGHGFSYFENNDDLKNNRFYFIWDSQNLGNYKIGVVGQYDKNYKIISIEVI
jgi:hypothetical protein